VKIIMVEGRKSGVLLSNVKVAVIINPDKRAKAIFLRVGEEVTVIETEDWNKFIAEVGRVMEEIK
jgi:hypothetical protein